MLFNFWLLDCPGVTFLFVDTLQALCLEGAELGQVLPFHVNATQLAAEWIIRHILNGLRLQERCAKSDKREQIF